ncbi:MAG: PEP-CTERM sorting domain-containing protein [Chthoniobacteraceae bacterium]
MKKLPAIAAAFAAATSALFAQSFAPSAGYSSVKLFDSPAGQTISGLEFDSAGNAYYLVGNGTSLPTHLEVRSSADNYATPTVLFDYGAAKFGSFVRLQAGKLYFGESTNGTIRVRDLSLGTTSLLATIANNYDLDFGGGVGWLSANPGFVGNRLFKLDLSTGATTQVLNSSDFSGPVAVDSSGRLYYGATAFGAGGNVYRYSSAEANAGGLTLDAGHVWSPNSDNAYFDLDASAGLYQTDFSTVKLLDLVTGSATSVGSSADTIGNLASVSGKLALAVTNYGGAGSADDLSSVFAVVPEPSSALLLAFAAAGLAARRRR